MAERRNARSSSRRNTATSPPKSTEIIPPALSSPLLAKRVTRSQSHDLAEAETAWQNSRRTNLGASVESTGSRRSNTRTGARTRPLEELPIVMENQGSYINLEDEDEQTNTDDNPPRRLSRRDDSPGNLSVISGTTTETSHSFQELADLNCGEMMDALPDLETSAERILSFLALRELPKGGHTKIIEDLQDPTSRASRKLNNSEKAFQPWKEVYGHERFINTSIAVRGLLSVRRMTEVGDGPWRPDDIFHKANLSIIMSKFMSSQSTAIEAQSLIEKIERDFPAPLVSQLASPLEKDIHTAGKSFLFNETLEVAFELRVQLFICFLKQFHLDPNFDPNDLFMQMFYEDSKTLRGWDVDGLRTENLSRGHRELLTQKLGDLGTMIPGDPLSLHSEVKSVADAYPWVRFLSILITWARLRLKEIDGHLTLLNGAGGIQVALEQEVERRQALPDRNEKAVDEASSPLIQLDLSVPLKGPHNVVELSEPSKALGDLGAAPILKLLSRVDSPATVQHVKRKFAAIKARQAISQKQRSKSSERQSRHDKSSSVPGDQDQAPIDQPEAEQRSKTALRKVSGDTAIGGSVDYDLQDTNFDETPTDSRNNIPNTVELRAQAIQAEKESVAEQDKENQPQTKFPLSRRRNKQGFVDRQLNAKKVLFDSQSPTQPESSNMETNQRHRESEDEADQVSDVSEDEGFEVASSSAVARAEQRRKGKRPAQLPAVQPASKRTRITSRSEMSVNLDADYRNAIDEVNVLPLSQVEAYKMANDKSKTLRTGRDRNAVQTRTRWTDEETETLLNLIIDHGTSWAYLQKLDRNDRNVLVNRDQVAIKDKARNMRIDYLKTGIAEPFNFDRIALKRADREKLRSYGVEVDGDED